MQMLKFWFLLDAVLQPNGRFLTDLPLLPEIVRILPIPKTVSQCQTSEMHEARRENDSSIALSVPFSIATALEKITRRFLCFILQ